VSGVPVHRAMLRRGATALPRYADERGRTGCVTVTTGHMAHARRPSVTGTYPACRSRPRKVIGRA